MTADITPDVPWDTQQLRAAYERGRTKEPCPNCGSFDYVPQHTLYTGIETTYQACNDCDHHWGHE